MEQRSEEWFAARLGKVTASKIHCVMAKGRGGSESITKENYIMDLVAEHLTGRSATPMFSSPAIDWGVEMEPEARDMYSFITNKEVEETGFIAHPLIPLSGASPDGLVGNTGLVEIKCPNTQTHLKYLSSGRIDKKYICQMNWQMACTGRLWCDFISYDPRAPENLLFKMERIERDEYRIEEMENAVRAFVEDLSSRIEGLRAIEA